MMDPRLASNVQIVISCKLQTANSQNNSARNHANKASTLRSFQDNAYLAISTTAANVLLRRSALHASMDTICRKSTIPANYAIKHARLATGMLRIAVPATKINTSKQMLVDQVNICP